MATYQLVSTRGAAMFLGISSETLRSWRRRGVGPSYVRYVGRDVRHDRISYPLAGLQAFVKRLKVQAGRLPRPFPGRLPGKAGSV